MSKSTEAISRPKVRFSEFSGNTPNKDEIGERCTEKAVLQANRPRIRSIEILKKPLRVVYLKKPILNKDIPLSDCKKDILAHSTSASENISNIFSSIKNVDANTSKILCNSNGTWNVKENCKVSQLDKSLQDNILKDCEKKLQQIGKENKDTVSKKKIISGRNTSKSRRDSEDIQSVAQKQLKLSTSKDTQKIDTVNVQSLKTIKLPSTPRMIKAAKSQTIKAEIFHAKPATPNVMPCYKKVAKDKEFQVKKTVLHNVQGSKIKISVEPGVLRKSQDNARTDNANERYIAEDIAAERLAQPEYNSIMCTVNKLKECKQQRIVTDIDHLPSAQKNLLIGKISTALDFPLDEVIYKNLVDLSIDEKQLPPIIIRNKNPEPRQKDIVPKLSDFFIPEDTNDICEAVQIKPRIPKIDENMHSFTMFDGQKCLEILERWKDDLKYEDLNNME